MRTHTAVIVAGVCIFTLPLIPTGYWPLMWVIPTLRTPLKFTDDGLEHRAMRRELRTITHG